jgi:hypothetical protein
MVVAIDLFSNNLVTQTYIVPNDWMTNEWCIGKDGLGPN